MSSSLPGERGVNLHRIRNRGPPNEKAKPPSRPAPRRFGAVLAPRKKRDKRDGRLQRPVRRPGFARTRVDRRLELPGRASSPVLYCSADDFAFVVASVTRAKVKHVWTSLS